MISQVLLPEKTSVFGLVHIFYGALLTWMFVPDYSLHVLCITQIVSLGFCDGLQQQRRSLRNATTTCGASVRSILTQSACCSAAPK